MNYLYHNTLTNELGISFEVLKTRFPNVSLSSDIKEIGDYKAYEKTYVPNYTSLQYVIEDIPVDGVQVWTVIDKEITPEFLNEQKQIIKNKITEKRWEIESGGMTFQNGISVKTSKDDQDRIMSVIINAERNNIQEIDFKALSGWTKISLTSLIQLSRELTFFVQNCFKIEKMHHDAVDLITDINELFLYDYNTGWNYESNSEASSILDIYSMNKNDIVILLYKHFIFPKIQNDLLMVNSDIYIQAQSIIDKEYYKMENLLPTQFYYLLARSGLDDAINILLPPLKDENINKYSAYKSYLNGARFYEFSKALRMYLDIKEKLLLIDGDLNFTIEQLKEMWIEASKI